MRKLGATDFWDKVFELLSESEQDIIIVVE